MGDRDRGRPSDDETHADRGERDGNTPDRRQSLGQGCRDQEGAGKRHAEQAALPAALDLVRHGRMDQSPAGVGETGKSFACCCWEPTQITHSLTSVQRIFILAETLIAGLMNE